MSTTILTRKAMSPVGELRLYATDKGLLYIGLPNKDVGEEEGKLAELYSSPIEEAFHELEDAVNELAAYFAGYRRAFGLELDRSLSSGFAAQVHRYMETIPYGEAVSYKDVAVALGNPDASRAVGNACGANPLPIVVPCHRVLTSAGTLGGYGGGHEMKSYLLNLEGIPVRS